MLAVMLTTTFVNALLMLHSATRNNQVLLDTLQVAMTQVEDDKALVKSQVDDAYISYARQDGAVVVPTTVMSSFTRTGTSKAEVLPSWVAAYSTPSATSFG